MTIAHSKTFDRQALVDIYDRFSPGLFRYSVRLLGVQDLAEECVSETFSRFLHAVKKGGGPSENVQAYLYRVAHNWITDYYRRDKSKATSLEIEEPVDHDNSPSQILSQKLLKDHIRIALTQLPFEQQYVIELRFLENRPHEEIAEALGKSPEATRALQYRALKSLREMLIEAEE